MNVYCCHELEEEICSAPASSYHSAVLTCALLFDVVSVSGLLHPWLCVLLVHLLMVSLRAVFVKVFTVFALKHPSRKW